MSIYLKIGPKICDSYWEYSYIERISVLSVTSKTTGILPLHTLQGSYELYIDIDQTQRITSFEVIAGSAPKYWNVVPDLIVPISEIGEVYLERDIDDGQEQFYFTDSNYTIFYTRFGEVEIANELKHIAISRDIILDIACDGMLAGVWMLELPVEIAKTHM